jgi:endonuclease/exonuclease/phosphatase (EEP) superfamily protein YafD
VKDLRTRVSPPIVVKCQCGKVISVAAVHRGKRIKCKNCGRELVVGRVSRVFAAARPIVTLASLAYLVAICALAAVMWGYGDVWWPATVVLFIGRWVFLLPLIVLVPAALVFRWTMLVPLAIAALVCAGPLMGGRIGWQRYLRHPAGTHLRVMSFNTDASDRIATELSGLIEEVHPDVVAMQECGELLIDSVTRFKGWYHHVARQQCFLSRFPIADSAVMDRRALERIDETGDIGGSGDVIRYTLRMPGADIAFTNVHLETPRKGLEDIHFGVFSTARLRDNTELRRVESDLASRWAKANASTMPTIVAGDFNTPVESRIFRTSWGDMADAFSRVGRGFGMTKMNGWISARIDHVLAGRGVYIDGVFVGRDVGSDHLPLVVDLTVVPFD